MPTWAPNLNFPTKLRTYSVKNNGGSRIKRYDVGISIFSRIRAMFRIAMFSQCQVECWHVIVDMNFLNFLKWKTKSWKTTVWDSNDSSKTGMGFVLSRNLFYLGFFGAAAKFQLRIGFAFWWMLDRISWLVIDWNQRSLACSRRSDSGERCEVKKSAKK